MPAYQVAIDEASNRRLRAIAAQLCRSVESLIESAAEEAALDHFRHRDDDPARQST